MATKLYFHDAAYAGGGTPPSGEQATATPSWTATGGATNRTMNTVIGVAQASLAGTTLNNTAAQTGLLGMFISPPLSGAQTVGGGTMVLNTADKESNAAANFWIDGLNVYVWRPSTGTKVGTLRDARNLGGTEATTGETVTHISGITSTGISASDGDVLVCEVWAEHTQSMATAYTATFYYDGTTENATENATVSNHASYLQLAETLTFKEYVYQGADWAAKYLGTKTDAQLYLGAKTLHP